MNEPHDPNLTVDNPPAPADSLDAGLAAGFGKASGPPRSSLGDLRPVLLKEAEGESAHVVKPKSDAMPPKEVTGDRYRLDGEIARGGMGAVLRGRDVDLGRDLAVKVLLERYANRPEVARRFIEEAQIGGQLQHPGVVPVYDIGRFGDRPFFTMKLVKGQTLAAILEERKDATADRPRLLGIALKVSETLAYAHAKGVIHRDLKPANIMVGAFGEVQVMDWGLAKVLAEGGIADEERASRAHQEPEDVTTIRTARSTGSTGSFGTDTEAGSLLGTPAYMPPEQANGDIANLDRRADVFGLGAILCEILTGKPPYVGRSAEEVRRKASNGDLADAMARLDACGADAELIALTKQCLSAEAIDRPRDAQAVTDGLSAYLNGVQQRLQTAERERAVAVVREAEQRKKRKAQLALAAAVVGLMLGGGAFAFWRAEQAQVGRERDARNAEAVASLLGQTEDALKAGDAAKASVVLEAAKKRSAEGGADKETDRLKRLETDLMLLRDLDAIDQFRWTSVESRLPDLAAVATRTREALKRFGVDPEAALVDEAAARVTGSAIRERIFSALDRILRQEIPVGVRAILKRVDSDPYRDAVREAIFARDAQKVAELIGQETALEQPQEFVVFLGESHAISVERRRELLQTAIHRRPRDLGALMNLGWTYPVHKKEGSEERVRWFQAAIAAAPGNLAAQINLGLALRDKGKLDDAISCFRKAVELDPKDVWAHTNLGVVLRSKGEVDSAIACHNKAIEIDPKIAIPHNDLGLTLREKGDLEGAIACFRRALELDPTFVWAHLNLGNILKQKGDLTGATACYRTALELDPTSAPAHNNLGNLLKDRGQVDEAIACYKKALEFDPMLALAHTNLGIALKEKGQVDEAIACYKKALELEPKHVSAHTNLGVALNEKGQVDEAIACYKKALEFDPMHVLAQNNLGNALRSKGQADDAIACFRKAIETNPKFASAHFNLGLALREKKDMDGAIESFLKALELDPKHAKGHLNLGTTLAGKGRLDEAIASYRKAIDANPKFAMAHYNLGNALKAKGQSDESIACYAKAIELDPNYAEAHCNLGGALRQKGRFQESLDATRRGHELGTKREKWSYPSAEWVRQAELIVAQDAQLSAFLKGEFQPANNKERLALAAVSLIKKLHHTAARLYSDAFSTDPKLADNLTAGHRYNAACYAALAAAGLGEDAAKLDDKEKARLRKQALDWLRDDLNLWTKQLEAGSTSDRAKVRQTLFHWQQDNDLAGIRDAAALAKLSANERTKFTQLWADVAGLLKKTQEKRK